MTGCAGGWRQSDDADSGTERQGEAEDGTAAGFGDGPDAAAVVFDDVFADGKTESGAGGFAMGEEGCEELLHNIGRKARTAVFDLGDDFASSVLEANGDDAPIRHDVGGIAEKIVEDAVESAGVEREDEVGHGALQLDTYLFALEFFTRLLDDLGDVGGKVHGFDGMLGGAFADAEQFVEHATESIDLLVHAFFRLLAQHGAGTGGGGGITGKEDDAERVFQIMHDGPHEAAEHGKAFSLKHLMNKMGVGLADAIAEGVKERTGEFRAALHELYDLVPGDEEEPGILQGGDGGGARGDVDGGHFAKEFTGSQFTQRVAAGLADKGGNVNPAFQDGVNAIARASLCKNDLTGFVFTNDGRELLLLDL